MKLYSERHGIRAPKKKTYLIDENMYTILFNCCSKYKKNWTHLFMLNCHHDFTDSDYIMYDEKMFIARIKMKIPSLFNDDDRICTPGDGEEYDQYALLDCIEYFAQNIKDISEHWNNERYQNYKTIDCYDTSNVFLEFQDEINELFSDSGLLYVLTDEKIVERVVENSPLTAEIKNMVLEVKEKGTKELLEDAIALFKTPNPVARQDSVEKLWDALERLKTYYDSDKKKTLNQLEFDMADGNEECIKLFDDEFRNLTDIGNKYRIRHHETDRIDINDFRHYDYFFNRCLSLIALAIQYLE